MKIYSVKFKGSFEKLNDSSFIIPEYAFIGRSNVGKSSLINFILNCKIAKVSSKPGCTKLINTFLINNKWFFIDLPGYGFFSIKKKKHSIKKLIINYIFYRKNLICLFLLIDSRIPIQKIDLYFIHKLKKFKINFCVIFTKIDKLNKKIFNKNISLYKTKIKKYPYFLISTKKKYGRKKIIQYIKNLNIIFQKKFL
ncbi:ribosome biogenesis GTP-binding protein YihA/YsxC [Blattabacterium cuenoti]|uniref:ribosome biogenesis GTP-binding protein YihA/YsxC n=1 Tax=Blattabacterium cuenoti TaxID=1653831 RepID=UPI00163C087E|nr:ribosome biogenesis GTP-binding protein YihA/YsxC [Blattabacterium cuenoti]